MNTQAENQIEIAYPRKGVSVSAPGKGNRIRLTGPIKGSGTVLIETPGDFNEIEVGPIEVVGFLGIRCAGNNGRVKISGIWVNKGLNIINGAEINGVRSTGAVCTIGTGVTVESLVILNHHTDGSVSIGDMCMISHNVTLMNSDTHPVYDIDSGEIINRPKSPLRIGNHVWLGQNVTVLKGVSIANDSVVGMGSLVTQSVEEPNVVLAGSPARIVRHRAQWATCDNGFL